MATYSNSISGRETGATSTTLTNCATVTRVPAFGTPLTPGERKALEQLKEMDADQDNVYTAPVSIV